MARPTIGHLDPAFVQMMDELQGLLRRAFRTENELTIPLSAPGSAGMEACFVNLVEPGDTVIVCRNGVFGERMRQNVVRLGATPVMVDDAWGEPVSAEKLEAALGSHPEARTVAFVHAETSTGVLSDAQTLVAIAHAHDCLAIVDTVTSLGGCPVEVDAWGIDAAYAGSQKCLSCTPGLAPLTFGPRAVERLRTRETPVQSWFLDLTLLMGYWGSDAKRSYHHTAPINPLYGLHEALLLLEEEGLEHAWARHLRTHTVLVEGLEALGLSLPVAPEARIPQLNAVAVPEGVDEALVRRRLLDEYGLEIGAGIGELAGRIWRIGLMGHACRLENVLLCLTALEAVLGTNAATDGRRVECRP
jgi:alanine-glyoxylate transaminase/serine-glyoxylate transaminase/serine-pyruvate transaminase